MDGFDRGKHTVKCPKDGKEKRKRQQMTLKHQLGDLSLKDAEVTMSLFLKGKERYWQLKLVFFNGGGSGLCLIRAS